MRQLSDEAERLPLSFQLVGMWGFLIGIGYWLTASRPLENRDLLLRGTAAKLGGPAFAVWYIVNQQLPVNHLINLVIADLMWLPPFTIILCRLYQYKGTVEQKDKA